MRLAEAVLVEPWTAAASGQTTHEVKVPQFKGEIHKFVFAGSEQRPAGSAFDPAMAEWNLSRHTGSFARGGLDLKSTADHFQPFSHAEQPEAFSALGVSNT